MQPEPQKEHQWLQRLVGEWSYETETVMEPGKPPEKLSGSEIVRAIGGIWMQCEGKGYCPGEGPATVVMTLGFDPTRGRFVGTFIGSMMTHLWIYDGQLDAAARVLTLEAEGPSFTAPGKTALYRDVIEVTDDDHRTLSASVRGDDGSWKQFMTSRYRRVK